MVCTIVRLGKLAALRRIFYNRGMLAGVVSSYMRLCRDGEQPPILPLSAGNASCELEDDNDDNIGPMQGFCVLSSIHLATTQRSFLSALIHTSYSSF